MQVLPGSAQSHDFHITNHVTVSVIILWKMMVQWGQPAECTWCDVEQPAQARSRAAGHSHLEGYAAQG